VIDLIDFQKNRKGNIVTDQLKVWPIEQMRNVELLRRKEVVEANDIVPLSHQSLAHMRAEKTRSAGDENTLQSLLGHNLQLSPHQYAQ
jgi:hypothetical protein